MVGKNNTDETPMETKLEETLSDPTANFSFEDDKVGTSFALIGWPVLSSLGKPSSAKSDVFLHIV